MIHQELIVVPTRGRSTHELTGRVAAIVAASGVYSGLCHVFTQHTSASLMLCENADPAVREDLERWFGRLVVDGDPEFHHDAEGPDDMAAHVRTLLAGASVMVPVGDGRCLLGTWQGIYLWEHRTGAFERRVLVTVQGEDRPRRS